MLSRWREMQQYMLECITLLYWDHAIVHKIISWNVGFWYLSSYNTEQFEFGLTWRQKNAFFHKPVVYQETIWHRNRSNNLMNLQKHKPASRNPIPQSASEDNITSFLSIMNQSLISIIHVQTTYKLLRTIIQKVTIFMSKWMVLCNMIN